MKVLMFGWEFPPHLSGGLGTACYGLTRALASRGTEIIFVLPRLGSDAVSLPGRLRLRSASGVVLWEDGTEALPLHEQWRRGWSGVPSGIAGKVLDTVWKERLHIVHVDSGLFPYATETAYQERIERFGTVQEALPDTSSRPYESVMPERVISQRHAGSAGHTKTIRLHGGYGKDLMTEVFRYSQAALGMLNEDFDVIHTHDWMTYPAGMVVKHLTGKPLVAHIHALECDRSGVNMNTEVAAIEKAGLEAADVVVAVSHYTKSRVVALYGINPDKIEVVHNAVTRSESRRAIAAGTPHGSEKRVLFMGRVTYQKGPEYFVEAARLVLTRLPDTRFIMAGSGDMLARMVYRVAQLRLGNRFHFTGFLRGEDVDRIYAMSDLYVMPSVSEPFGIAPLEAMAYDVPVIISRQSGVSEVVRHALKVNFWDTRDLADKICAVLSYPCLAEELVRNCREELKTIRWENAADRLNAIYARCVGGHTGGGC